jgi:hypothetical protein
LTKKAMTAAWLSNAKKSFAAAGLDFKKLPSDADREYLARLWSLHVDAGEDFGTAAIHVLDNLEKASKASERV